MKALSYCHVKDLIVNMSQQIWVLIRSVEDGFQCCVVISELDYPLSMFN